MSDDVRRMSDALAQDPGSRVFVPLGEALRRQGQRDLALKVALKGLERHPHLADAHDLLARLYADDGDIERAFDEWDMVLRLSPGHLGALKGMGFICFHRERFVDAERYLAAAAASDPSDAAVASALAHLRTAQVEAKADTGAAMADAVALASPGIGLDVTFDLEELESEYIAPLEVALDGWSVIGVAAGRVCAKQRV